MNYSKLIIVCFKAVIASMLIMALPTCKAPTESYLTKDDGKWNIDEMHYSSDFVETTFENCGEMHIITKTDLNGEKDKEWEIEGTIYTLDYIIQDATPNWIWTTWHFKGDVKNSYLAPGSKITIFNSSSQEVAVTKRSGDKMVWEFTNENAVSYIFKFSRK